jgi:hypothetical protein
MVLARPWAGMVYIPQMRKRKRKRKGVYKLWGLVIVTAG